MGRDGDVAAPVLVLTGLVNWDLLPVACVAGAFWAPRAAGPLLAGVIIGLGTAAKLYPRSCWGRSWSWPSPPAGARLLLATVAAVGAWLAVNVPVMLVDLEGWKGFWSFNSDRAPTSARSGWWPATTGGRPGSAP